MKGNFPVIDKYRTGQKIHQMMEERGLTVHDIQTYLGFATPQGIYHWFSGRNLPSIDNLYALSGLFRVPVDAMLCGNRTGTRSDLGMRCRRLNIYCEKLRQLLAA